MKNATLAAGLLLITSICCCQTFEESLDYIRNQNNLVGLAVGVACEGEPLASYYNGFANVSSGAAINENTLFRIASISKTFTAVGMMRLFDQGLFDLDADVSDTLGYTLRNPAFPDQVITYRMFLSHTSSLQDGTGYNNFLNTTFSGSGEVPHISELLIAGGDFYTTNMWRTEAPGTYFAYSNVNFGVIGTLIEKLSNTRFDVFMQNEVLTPLEIVGGFNVAELENIGNVAVLYRNNIAQQDNYNGVNPGALVDESYVLGTNGLIYGPQGGLRTNLNGLLQLGNVLANSGNFNGDAFLSASTVELMLSDQWTYNGANGDNYFGLFNSWGLGIHRALDDETADEIINNQLMLGHAGEAYGLISDLFFDPESRMVLAFITNGYSSGGNYNFGENSSFYAPEEETFDLIEETHWSACQVLSTTSYTPLPCDAIISYQGDGWFEITISLERSAKFYDLLGREITVEKEAGRFRFDAGFKGVAVARVITERGVCSLKFFVAS